MVRRATVQYEGATVQSDGATVRCDSPKHAERSDRRTALSHFAPRSVGPPARHVSASLEFDVCLSE